MGRWRSVYTAADVPSQNPTPQHPALPSPIAGLQPPVTAAKGEREKRKRESPSTFQPLLKAASSAQFLWNFAHRHIYFFAHRYIASRFGILLRGTSPTFSHRVDLSPSPLFTLFKEMSPACFPPPHHRSPSIPLISKQGESIARPLRAASHLLRRITEGRSDLGSQVLQLLYVAFVIFFLGSNMGAAM